MIKDAIANIACKREVPYTSQTASFVFWDTSPVWRLYGQVTRPLQAIYVTYRRMHSSRLIIVCGLPGAGKTTLAKSLESHLSAVRLSPDEWMDTLDINLWDERRRAKIEDLQWRLAQQLLKLRLKVIIKWGTWGRSERDTFRLGARALGAAVELHYLAVPADVLFERVHRRGMEDPPVDRQLLQQWYDAFQAPTSEEMLLFDPPLNQGEQSEKDSK